MSTRSTLQGYAAEPGPSGHFWQGIGLRAVPRAQRPRCEGRVTRPCGNRATVILHRAGVARPLCGTHLNAMQPFLTERDIVEEIK